MSEFPCPFCPFSGLTWEERARHMETHGWVFTPAGQENDPPKEDPPHAEDTERESEPPLPVDSIHISGRTYEYRSPPVRCDESDTAE